MTLNIIESRQAWEEFLRREYPGVSFLQNNAHPRGIDAVAASVLVGRFYSSRNPPYGVIFDQPRSCGGKI